MKQRLGVAQALVNAPQLLLLDEPTSALDPLGRKEILDMVSALRGRTTVFFSSHILADVERVCDHVAVLHRGRVVAYDDTRALRRGRSRQRLRVTVDDPGALLAALRAEPWPTAVAVDGDDLLVSTDDPALAERRLPALVAHAGLRLRSLRSDELTREEVFVDLIHGPESTP